MPALPVIPAPLTDGQVSLRPIAARDIPEILIAFQDDAELHHRLGVAQPPSGAELGRQVERAEAERAAGVWLALSILAAGRDTCLGQVNVHQIDWEHRRAELGVWLEPGVRGRGLAPRALRLAWAWLLGPAGLQRVELRTETDNRAMLTAAAAAGFTREGVLRGYTLERGRRVDQVVFSRLPADVA